MCINRAQLQSRNNLLHCHCLLKNNGNNKFEMISLPYPAQYSCINGMIPEDFDGDGNLDLLVNGNDYGTEPTIGRYDACNGLLLRGDGSGKFTPLSILQSGWFVPGNGKSLVKLRNASGGTVIAAAQNRGVVKLYNLKKEGKTLPLLPGEHTAVVRFKNGKQQRVEAGYGTSFLSQSGRFLNVGSGVSSVEVTHGDGKKRVITY
jgi:WD40 repeat protein